MDAIIVTDASTEEIAAIVLAIQKRRNLEPYDPIDVSIKALAEILAARDGTETTAQGTLSS